MFIATDTVHTEAAHALVWAMHLVSDLERAVGSEWDGMLRTWDWEDVSKRIGLVAARELTERGLVRCGKLFRYVNAAGDGYVTLRQWCFTRGGQWMLAEVLRERAGTDGLNLAAKMATVVRTTGRA